ncbi:MAG: 4-hydroxy-tetrahydrodipicolinate reductase [Nitrospirae bacterium]|nr:4-hydroxy-tetrahydrodipicolinate reductase [Nitrospirota bacterium]
MIRAIVTGAAGRMGCSIIRAIHQTDGIDVVGAVEQEGHPLFGKDAGEVAGIGPMKVRIVYDLENIVDRGDVVIDFTNPAAALANMAKVAATGKAWVIGSTGFTKDEEENLRKLASGKTPCVFSPNMSVGVNIVFRLIQDVAKVLGDEYDVEIVEAHHRHKKDAPSGTAMKMANIIASSLGRDLSAVGKFSRHGITGERDKKEIGVQSIRAGDIVGDHTVMFCGTGERIEITHKAQNRDNFANGAVRAAVWVVKQKPGMYDMMDVLGLKK